MSEELPAELFVCSSLFESNLDELSRIRSIVARSSSKLTSENTASDSRVIMCAFRIEGVNVVSSSACSPRAARTCHCEDVNEKGRRKMIFKLSKLGSFNLFLSRVLLSQKIRNQETNQTP